MNYFIEYNHPGRDSMHHQNGGGMFEAPPVYLRFIRAKGKVTPAYSYDGRVWKEQQSGPMEFPEKVAVGVYALQITGQAATATFEEFTVTPLPAEREKK